MSNRKSRFRAREKAKCTAKKKYPTQEIAISHLIAAWAHGLFHMSHAYRCPWCRKWHLTSTKDVDNVLAMLSDGG